MHVATMLEMLSRRDAACFVPRLRHFSARFHDDQVRRALRRLVAGRVHHGAAKKIIPSENLVRKKSIWQNPL